MSQLMSTMRVMAVKDCNELSAHLFFNATCRDAMNVMWDPPFFITALSLPWTLRLKICTKIARLFEYYQSPTVPAVSRGGPSLHPQATASELAQCTTREKVHKSRPEECGTQCEAQELQTSDSSKLANPFYILCFFPFSFM